MKVQFDENALGINGVKADQDYSINIVENPSTNDPVFTPFVDRDANFENVVDTATHNNFIIEVVPSVAFDGTPVFESATPETASVDADGHVSLVSEGAARVLVKMPAPLGTRAVARTMDASSVQHTRNYFRSYAAGSLGDHITQAILDMVSGVSATDTTKNMFASNNYSLTAPAVVRNSNIFTGALDLSAISVINGTTGGGYIHPGMLLSTRHIVTATHFQTGDVVVFMRPDGSFVTANVVSRSHHVGGALTWDGITDVTICYLDTEVTDITPFKLLPANWSNYLPTAKRGAVYGTADYKTVKLPCLAKTAHNASGLSRDQISVNEVIELQDAPTDLGVSVLTQTYTSYFTVLDSSRFYSPIVGGDSGGPNFFLISGEKVLIMNYHLAGAGTHLGDIAAEINTVMNAQATAASDPAAGTYAVDVVDLSGFTSYA